MLLHPGVSSSVQMVLVMDALESPNAQEQLSISWRVAISSRTRGSPIIHLALLTVLHRHSNTSLMVLTTEAHECPNTQVQAVRLMVVAASSRT